MFLFKKIKSYLVDNFLCNYKKPIFRHWLYNFCLRYVYFFQGECNADPKTNGEGLLLETLLKNNKITMVFDVGANIGEYTQRLIKLNPKLSVHCFEPSKRAFVELKDKFINNLNVNCSNLALGDVVGKRKFYNFEESTTFSSFYLDFNTQAKPVEGLVEVDTLDNYCEGNKINHIDLLKIDVEGHELSILNGSQKLFQEGGIEIVQFEYGHAALPARAFLYDFFVFFEKYGYLIYRLKYIGWELQQYTPWLDKCPYANFFAIKKDSFLLEVIENQEIIL
ncbi:MAG: FkbM family methyltransferase [Candidatus Komeilibacteria bacterium]|nr:FkbM family methyltransferase [Candidatus Komeilibacteria bacterium]